MVRLLPVTERSKALFGQEGASAVADWIEIDPMAGLWRALFADAGDDRASASHARGRRLDPDAEIQTNNPTALDRHHVVVLLGVLRQGAWAGDLPVHRPVAVAILIDLQPTPNRHSKRTMKKINSVSIKGFRSLADVELADLPNVAVMVGANGSGKSNFLRCFEMLKNMMQNDQLNRFVQLNGGADDQLFNGSEVTKEISAQIAFSNNKDNYTYRFNLEFAEPDRLVFFDEAFKFWNEDQEPMMLNLGQSEEEHDPSLEAVWHNFVGTHNEAGIVKYRCKNDGFGMQNGGSCEPRCSAAKEIVKFYSNCSSFHFHDTSITSRMKISYDIFDRTELRPDGGNIAPILMSLEQNDPERYDYICYQIRRIVPNFESFYLSEEFGKVILRWKTLDSDKIFGAHLASDGSLRFFALVTLLHLPDEMLPDVIFLDEPELGLHPAAVSLLAGMIRVMSHHRQVILATQSPALVDEFNLPEIIVLNLKNGVTEMNQLDEEEYKEWLEEYSTGELWKTNTFGGTPWSCMSSC